jgi:adenylosuccinate lyase
MTLYMQDFLMDLNNVNRELESLPMRGLKGTTGTQATFLELFEGDHEKVKECNRKVCAYMGFDKWVAVSGQTYTRKIDYQILSVLSGIAQSAYKMCGDIRLLANLKEIEEPFGKDQIGSSAMAYKRNPMRSERVCSLARYVMGLPAAAAQTHATQWFERTLDDSSIRRIILPEGFLAVDVILNIVANVTDGLQVWPQVIRKNLMAELPFMATEKILMACCKKGGDRQVLHHAIREHSMDAGKVVKAKGKPNDLMERIKKDPLFASVHDELDALVDPMLFVGRAPEQVDEFLAEEIDPVLKKYAALLTIANKDGVSV